MSYIDDLQQQYAQGNPSPQQAGFLGLPQYQDPAAQAALARKIQQLQFASQFAAPQQGAVNAGAGVANLFSGIADRYKANQQQDPTQGKVDSLQNAVQGLDATGQAPQAPGANMQLAIKKVYQDALATTGDEGQARIAALTTAAKIGLPGAAEALASAQDALGKRANTAAETQRNTAQAAASTDELRHRGVDESQGDQRIAAENARVDLERQRLEFEKTQKKQNAFGTGADESLDFDSNPASPAEIAIAKKKASGDIKFGSLSARNATDRRTTALALNMNPDITEQTYQTKQRALNAIKGAGKQGDQVRAFNVAYSHLNTANQLIDALNNSDNVPFNVLANKIATLTGQPAPTNLGTALDIVKAEVTKGIVGSQSTGEERKNQLAGVTGASSPAQLQGTIKVAKDLLQGQIGGVRKQFSNVLNDDEFNALLDPQVLQDYKAFHAAQPAAAPASSGWGKASVVK